MCAINLGSCRGLVLRDRQSPWPCLAGQANRNQHRMVRACKAMSV